MSIRSSDPDFGRGGYGLYSTIDEYRIIADFLATGRNRDGDVLLGPQEQSN